MQRKKMAWLGILGIVLLSTTWAAALDVAKTATVYKGPDGIVVSVVKLAPADTKEALIKVTGVDDKWDLKIKRHRIRKSGDRTEYVTRNPNDTRDWVALISESRDGKINTTLYLKSSESDLKLTYDEALSAKAVPTDILKEYLGQEAAK